MSCENSVESGGPVGVDYQFGGSTLRPAARAVSTKATMATRVFQDTTALIANLDALLGEERTDSRRVVLSEADDGMQP